MRGLAARLTEANPETLVIATPHNLRLRRYVGVVLSENSSGRVALRGNEVALSAKCDLELGNEIFNAADQRGIPVVGANYGTLSGPLSNLPMDFGSLIPLWFFIGRGKGKKRIVIVTPAIDVETDFEFGRVVAEVAERSERRIAFIASADQAHTHLRSGPYGYSKEAARYDRKVLEAVKGGRLHALMRLPKRLVEGAKPDSLWQMTILAGVLDVVHMEPELLSYQVPTYYGMLCASYTRTN